MAISLQTEPGFLHDQSPLSPLYVAPGTPLPTSTSGSTTTATSTSTTSTAPKLPSDWDLITESERQRVTGEFGEARGSLQTSIHKRGMGRSGFSAEAMSKLGAKEGMALADVQAGITDRQMNYKFQQQQLAMMAAQAAKAKKKNKKKKKLGGALAIAGLVLAPFTGGASLALTAAGAGMYMG